KDIGNGIAFAGVEYYLPLFFERTATLFDYLPGAAITVTLGDPAPVIRNFTQDTYGRWQFLKSDRERPVLPPEALFLSDEELFGQLKRFARLALGNDEPAPDFLPLPDVAVSRRADDPVAALRRLVDGHDGRIALCADSAGRRETLDQMLQEFGLAPDTSVETLSEFFSGTSAFALLTAPLANGFGLAGEALYLLTENDLYPAQARTRRRGRRAQERASDVESMVRDLSELREGDPVVHVQHGIGRYVGLKEMDLGEGAMEFLHLEYAGGGTLYVPVAQLHQISRYSGSDPESAPLHQLGSGQWDKARRKAAKQVRDAAAELLALYAQRAAREGHRFKLPMQDYEAFAEGFGFEETPDQAAAIEAVLEDMTSGRPMD